MRQTEIFNTFYKVIHWTVDGHNRVYHSSTFPPTLGELRKASLGLGTGYFAEIIKKLCPSST